MITGRCCCMVLMMMVLITTMVLVIMVVGAKVVIVMTMNDINDSGDDGAVDDGDTGLMRFRVMMRMVL